MEEEDQLLNELKKIEQRKKEREKKTQDLQKLISAAESNIVDARKTDRKQNKKKQQQQQKQTEKNVRCPDTHVPDGVKVFQSTCALYCSCSSHRKRLA